MDLKIDILTSRKYEKRPWFDLVYEWEDEIKVSSQKLAHN